MHVHMAQFFSVYFLKNPLDKLNFVADTKNLTFVTLGEGVHPAFACVLHGFVCLFVCFSITI